MMIEHGQVVFSGLKEDFDNYIAPDTFVVALENPPQIEQLQEIPGIYQVEQLEPTRFRMKFQEQEDITCRMVGLSVANGWRLSEIRLERGSLDEVFAQLSGKKLRK